MNTHEGKSMAGNTQNGGGGMARNTAYRCAFSMAVATAFLLLWLNAAVGVIGNENDDANPIILGVLAVGVIGTLMARLQPVKRSTSGVVPFWPWMMAILPAPPASPMMCLQTS